MSTSMAEITGTATDGESRSVVARWLEGRGKTDHWKAPVHEVESAEWRSAFAFAEGLGSGGFGTVTHAVHTATGTNVAIKLVYDRTDDGKASAKSESVRREIETMRRMDHPAIVSLIEVFVHKPKPQDDHPEAPWVRQWYLVLEFCPGKDLQRILLEQGALHLDVVRQVFGQLALAVQYTHWRGVIHRDIKPGNVMILDPSTTGGRVRIKLLDFGLAELMDPAFIQYYRKAARRRSRAMQMPLPRALVEQDSVHGARQRGSRGIFGSARQAASSADNDDSASEGDSTHGRGGAYENASRGATPMQAGSGTPLPTITERRGTNQPAEAAPLPGTVAAAAAAARPAQPAGMNGSKAKASANPAKRFMPSPSRMSADLVPTGTREFAAPEVFAERRFKKADGVVGGLVDDVVVPTPMVTDSFSIGVLVRYALTGVPPGASDGTYVLLRRYNPAWRLRNALRGCAGRTPPARVLALSELPEEAQQLVSGLTEPDYHKRLTMGDLSAHPWVLEAAAANEEVLREMVADAVARPRLV